MLHIEEHQIEEHQGCFNYENEEYRTIESKTILEKEAWRSKTIEHRLIFITKGILNLRFTNKEIHKYTEGSLFFIPANQSLSVSAISDSVLVVFRIQKKIQLCANYPLESLRAQMSQNKCSDYEVNSLQFNNILKAYLEQLDSCLCEGIKCKYYCNLKLDELFVLLRVFYSKEQLVILFSSLLSPDISFSDYVIQNHAKHHTLNELAQSMNYSTSGFEKKFKKIFGVSGYKWMKEQKAHRVFNAICSESKNFKEIALDLGFSSESYFYDFCKTQIGLTPSEIRKKKNI